MIAQSSEDFFQSASSLYEPEYLRPADLSWMDNYQPSNVAQRLEYSRSAKDLGVLQFPQRAPEIEERDFPVPTRLLRLVPKLEYSRPTPHDGRARLAWHAQGMAESCEILRDDPHTGSWDIEGTLQLLEGLFFEFRLREQGEE